MARITTQLKICTKITKQRPKIRQKNTAEAHEERKDREEAEERHEPDEESADTFTFNQFGLIFGLN